MRIDESEFDEEISPEYKLTKKIGVGMYSSVWEAEHVASKKRVAVKKEVGVFYDMVDCKRLLREVKLLRHLQHPNVVKLIDVLISPSSDVATFETIFLVLEIVEYSLQKIVKSSTTLDHAQIKRLLYNILVGLNYIHSAGVLHRDLKPGNILVTRDYNVRICDFGLARSIVGLKGTLEQEAKEAKTQGKAAKKEEDKSKGKGKGKKEAKKVGGKAQAHMEGRVSISAAASVDTSPFAPGGAEDPDRMDFAPAPEAQSDSTTRLTTHVVTRWYRAPELILMQEDYGPAIDVWSMGCIFAELLSMLHGNSTSPQDRKPLFPGTSCLLLSPASATEGGRPSTLSNTSSDQLSVILEILGPLTKEDVAFIKDPEILEFIHALAIHQKPFNLAQKYPAAGKEALDLLKRMLAFNPTKRITVAECLAHPYLKDVRRKGAETIAMQEVVLPFEKEGDLTEERLRTLFGEEIAYYTKLKKAGYSLL